MNTKQYNYLITIASCQGISAASERLGISQAALSKFLAEQERILGVKLFVRYRKHMYPTPAGKLYLDAAQNILTVKNSTLQTINRLTHGISDPIRIASTPYRGAELSAGFSAAFPPSSRQLICLSARFTPPIRKKRSTAATSTLPSGSTFTQVTPMSAICPSAGRNSSLRFPPSTRSRISQTLTSSSQSRFRRSGTPRSSFPVRKTTFESWQKNSSNPLVLPRSSPLNPETE